MYAARDITNTVGCLGLIVSSIISKKVTGSLDIKAVNEPSPSTVKLREDSLTALVPVHTIHCLTLGCRWRRD